MFETFALLLSARNSFVPPASLFIHTVGVRSAYTATGYVVGVNISAQPPHAEDTRL